MSPVSLWIHLLPSQVVMPLRQLPSIVALYVALQLVAADAYYLCTCQCCTQGSCYRVPQMGVVVPDCGSCATADCVTRINAIVNISAVAQGATKGYKACLIIRSGEAAACKASPDQQRCTHLAAVGSTCQARSFALQYWSSHIWSIAVLVLLAVWAVSWFRRPAAASA